MNARQEVDMICDAVEQRTYLPYTCDVFSTSGYEARGFYTEDRYAAIIQQASQNVCYWARFQIWLVSTPATRTLFDARNDSLHELANSDGTRTPFRLQVLDHLAAINVISHAINHPARSKP